MRRVVDGVPSQIMRVLIRQVRPIAGTEHTVRVDRTTDHLEDLAGGACSLGIDVIQLRTALVVPGQHHSHADTHALVVVHNVGHDLAGSGHRNAFLVAQLLDSALLGQHPISVHTIGRTFPAGIR